MNFSHVIPAKAGIHQIISIFILFFLFVPSVFADAKSDYDFQYGQYRQNYSEYTLLKNDYLATPSLDNQQKAILAAKQTILSRDLAKASFTWYIMNLVDTTHTAYPPIQPIVASLGTSREYFLQQAQKSQGLVTQADLKNFSLTYQKDVLHPDRVVKFGIVAQKLATLVRIQSDSKASLDNLLTRIPSILPATVTARIQELKDSSGVIDGKIDTIATNLNFSTDEVSADAEIFFSSRVEKLVEIQSLQLDWINRLIDIEKNYATN